MVMPVKPLNGWEEALLVKLAQDLAFQLIVVKPLQFENASLPIEVTELPIVTLVKERHRSNACVPMEVTESGMVIFVRLRHPRNAMLPMEVTELGMVMLVNPLQP